VFVPRQRGIDQTTAEALRRAFLPTCSWLQISVVSRTTSYIYLMIAIIYAEATWSWRPISALGDPSLGLDRAQLRCGCRCFSRSLATR